MPNIEQKFIITEAFAKNLADRIVAALLEYKKVKVTHVGIFKIIRCKGRKMENPFTKKPIVVSPYNKIKFIPTRALRDKVQ